MGFIAALQVALVIAKVAGIVQAPWTVIFFPGVMTIIVCELLGDDLR